MRMYPIASSNSKIQNALYIGANHLANGMCIGNSISSYDKTFDNEDLVMVDDQRYSIVGNIKEAYSLLKSEIKAKSPRQLVDYSICVYNAVTHFFGDTSKANMRVNNYPKENEIIDGKTRGQISDLYQKNMALSIERAVVSQNLLIELGIKSTYKVSGAIIDEKECIHAYNLISHDGKYYIYDATIPNAHNARISPIICEIPEDVYNELSNPNSEIGISVETRHLNPTKNEENTIVYDAGREAVYKVDNSYTKKV